MLNLQRDLCSLLTTSADGALGLDHESLLWLPTVQGELICFIAPGRLLIVYGCIQQLLQALWKFTCKRFQ